MDNNLIQLGRIVKRRVWVLLLTALIICGLTAFYTLYMVTPEYEASTRIIVNNKSDVLLKPQDTEVNANILLIDTYKEIIRSAKIMDDVVKEHPEWNVPLRQLLSKVNVSSVSNTQIMILTVKDGSFKKAISIANAVTEQFEKSIPSIMNVDNVTILDRAEVASDANQTSPNFLLSMILSFILSLLLATGLIFLLESFDDTFKSDDEFEKILGIPHLGTIPTIAKKYLIPSRITSGRAADSKYAG